MLSRVREKKPLVHHLTNWVTIYDCANVTRVFGALPVMAHAREEVEEMVGIAQALVLNIGTLTPEFVDSMIKAGKAANKKKIPVILDVVGAGATGLRTNKTKQILENVRVDVIKGNSAEIGVVAGVEAEVKGVEAISVKGEPKEIAASLAKKMNSTVVITGKQDIIAGADKIIFFVDNGHELMGKIVGTGCMAASVIGAFCAVEKNHAKASAAALSCYGMSGELAAKQSNGPGSFKANFFDEIYNLDEEKITGLARVSRA
ncbi:hydroxyethylthiazole kinase [Candidatus Micrarchaeota archaeon]|nr:hydroxyethylthiazole kinase [Candidatus Micrarchaeota archaeon]